MKKDGITYIEMEKNGQITLTKKDLADFYSGNVSERVKQNWGFSFSELKEVIDNSFYKEI